MKKTNRIFSGKIRIIGGQWRGKKLTVIESPGLHPTSDRVRETLFNWLTPSILEAFCLDCFAGTGALGIEALSRSAANTMLLEINQKVAQQLQKNLTMLKIHNATIINTNTIKFLDKPGVPYDIVFVDPPFRKGLLEITLSLLEKNGWLAQESFIYVENEIENRSSMIPPNWRLYRKKVAGQVSYRLFHRDEKK